MMARFYQICRLLLIQSKITYLYDNKWYQKSPDLSTRADNERGLIKRAINKMSCYNLFITHSNPLFTEIYLKETTDFLSTEVMLEDV